MATEEVNDYSDWNNMSGSKHNEPPSVEETVTKKRRLPKKIRQIPDSYFLPRRSIPSAIALYNQVKGLLLLQECWLKPGYTTKLKRMEVSFGSLTSKPVMNDDDDTIRSLLSPKPLPSSLCIPSFWLGL